MTGSDTLYVVSRMLGLSFAASLFLTLACTLSGAALAVSFIAARNTYVLRADARKRDSDTWRLDQEESFAALRRTFLQLSDDVAGDLGRATSEREQASALNARAGKRVKRAEGVQQDYQPRTRDVVRRERLGQMRAVGGEE